MHAEDKPVRERFIVGGPVHRDDPTLSAAEARIQWYENRHDRGLPWLQWMATTSVVLSLPSRHWN